MTADGLAVDRLAAGYGAAPVLQQVALRCAPGQLVAVLGSNGAGKSTLMKAIAGLVRPSSGSVVLDGTDLAGLDAPAVARHGLVMVPEGRALFTGMTVWDNLLVGAYLYRRDRARIREQLDRVVTLFPRLGERRVQDVGTLSGGEQQMVALGRALMGRPRILLLDEPSLGLAPVVFQSLLEEIAKLRTSGTGVVLVEQNVRSTLRYADYAYLLQRGRVVAEGTAAEIGRHDLVESSYLAGGT
ncbi:MAG TPA: ABC transporter ATP-binding protein [Acidimicrobiales bacterium]|nr:ABC transporter ATP-binding protein [Acidimicrobiales bacterium]